MFIIYSAKIQRKNNTTKYFVLKFVKWIDLFYYILKPRKVVRDDYSLDPDSNLTEIKTGEGSWV